MGNVGNAVDSNNCRSLALCMHCFALRCLDITSNMVNACLLILSYYNSTGPRTSKHLIDQFHHGMITSEPVFNEVSASLLLGLS